jgi:tetratricopeptide (TPR) repeat protein
MAWVQLGLIAEATQQYDEALIAFQKAIEQFRPNYLARYNYELLKRRLRNQEVSQAPNPDGATQQQPQNARPDANGVAQTEQVPDKDGEEQNLPEKEANPSGTQTIEQATSNPSPEELALLKRLQQMNLDPETANMLLDAMKNQELQYWQQLQRIPKNNKHKNNKKPNW